MAHCGVDWDTYSFEHRTPKPKLLAKKSLGPHQRAAIDAVREGWESHDRGQLIMACGTGKTFTSLKVVADSLGGWAWPVRRDRLR